MSVITQFSSSWPMDRTLSGATTPGQSGPRSDGNEGVLCIPQSSSITGTLPSDCLVSYPGHSLEESYPYSKMQSVYSTAPADCRSSSQPNWLIDFTGLIADRWNLVLWLQHFGNPTITDLRKGKVIIHNFLNDDLKEIASCSEMSSTVTLLSTKMSSLTESIISRVIAVLGLPGLTWILFRPFFNLFVNIFLQKYASPYTSHIFQ